MQLAIAYFVGRVLLGTLFLFQGYDKLFVLKVKGVIEYFGQNLQDKKKLLFFLPVIAYYTSLIEFFGGIFLILGFMKMGTFIALGVDLLIVSLGFSLINPLWDMQHIFPRMAFLLFLLLLPITADIFSIDYLILKFTGFNPNSFKI